MPHSIEDMCAIYETFPELMDDNEPQANPPVSNQENENSADSLARQLARSVLLLAHRARREAARAEYARRFGTDDYGASWVAADHEDSEHTGGHHGNPNDEHTAMAGLDDYESYYAYPVTESESDDDDDDVEFITGDEVNFQPQGHQDDPYEFDSWSEDEPPAGETFEENNFPTTQGHEDHTYEFDSWSENQGPGRETLNASNIINKAIACHANVREFERFVHDDTVFTIVALFVQKSLGEDVNLLNYASWHFGRRIFLVGLDTYINAVAQCSPDCVEKDHEHGATVIAGLVEDLESRRASVGIASWGSKSQTWRVAYHVLELFLSESPPMLYDLVTRYGGAEWDEHTAAQLEAIIPAVRMYKEMMCARGEYDPFQRGNYEELSSSTENRLC